MIRKLTGIVDSLTDDGIIIDVQGVGYHVMSPPGMMDRVALRGQSMTLWVETQMNEHGIALYGFASEQDLEWFRLLVSVHGVGNRAALGILGALSLNDLTHAISSGEGAVLATVSGIGKKLVTRIVNELKDKLPQPLAEIVPVSSGAQAHAVSALVNLGYPEQRARSAVGKIMAAHSEQMQKVEDIIRACLQELAR